MGEGYTLQLSRMTIDRQASWQGYHMWRRDPATRKKVKLNIKGGAFPEHEATIKMLRDLSKKAEGMDDDAKITKLVDQALKSIQDAWYAGRLS